jgi:hypothetical protein
MHDMHDYCDCGDNPKRLRTPQPCYLMELQSVQSPAVRAHYHKDNDTQHTERERSGDGERDMNNDLRSGNRGGGYIYP